MPLFDDADRFADGRGVVIIVLVGLAFTYPYDIGPLIGPPPPPELPDEAGLVQTVGEGVMTFVTVPAPEYAREMDEADPLQVLLVTSLVMSDES